MPVVGKPHTYFFNRFLLRFQNFDSDIDSFEEVRIMSAGEIHVLLRPVVKVVLDDVRAAKVFL